MNDGCHNSQDVHNCYIQEKKSIKLNYYIIYADI